jgi:YtcA family
MGHNLLKPTFLVSLASWALGGGRGAPSFVIVGSYFPGWMFCALIGIVLAIAVRIGFVASGLANVLPYQLFVCAAIGLCGALALWLLWFGQ